MEASVASSGALKGNRINLLILGGTQFVGRHITEAALAHGHDVTLFNRGRTHADLFPSVRTLIGDRKSDVSALNGTSWDAVIDVNAYLPGEVARVLDVLTTAHYTFISTISVYADHHAGDDEQAPLASMPDGADETQVTGETYGPLKVACEQLVQTRLPDGALIIRPGLVVGPHDHTDRWTYWVVRTAQGGDMLAPGSPDRPMQVIDARDLAAFTVTMTEKRASGIYHVTGFSTPLGEILDAARRITKADTRFVWGDDAFLLEHDIRPWQDFPIWLPDADSGVHQKNIQKALQAGLAPRPIGDTLAGIWDWWQKERSGSDLQGGSLSREREAQLLADLARSQGL
jgi:2'-hydroxyisoflavone reductase